MKFASAVVYATAIYALSFGTHHAFSMENGGNMTVAKNDEEQWSRILPYYRSDSTIGDMVYWDDNGNGRKDRKEDGIQGVTLSLYGKRNKLIATTRTNRKGLYYFDQLGAGKYTVKITDKNNKIPNSCRPTQKPKQPINVNGKHDKLNVDFGFYCPPKPTPKPTPGKGKGFNPGSSSIGDTVYWDANYNYKKDSNEDGIRAVTLELYDDNNDWIATTRTNKYGKYLFTDLPRGKYTVKVTDDRNKIGDCKPTQEPNQPVFVNGRNNKLNVDFGFYCSTDYPTSTPTCEESESKIGDTVYWDENKNYRKDRKEDGIRGVTLSLYDSRDNLIATTITNNKGKYLFEGLSSGDYTVKVTDDRDEIGDYCTPTQKPKQPVYVDGKDDYLNVDFGFYCHTEHPTSTPTCEESDSKIGDTVYWDDNDNNEQNQGEDGIKDVTLSLFDRGGLVATTKTDKDGKYLFEGLPEGRYRVKVTDEYNKIPYDCHPSEKPKQPVRVDGKNDNLDVDFGYYCKQTDPPTHYPTSTPTCDFSDSTIGDTVYWDENGNGNQNRKDEGIEGVTLELLDADNKNKLIATTMTDGDGKYFFKGLPEGKYRVDVTDEYNKIPKSCKPTEKPDQPVYVDGKEDNLDVDFGYYCKTDSPTYYPTEHPTSTPTCEHANSDIGDTVYWDDNGDGKQNNKEKGIKGVTLELLDYDDNNKVIATTETRSKGKYLFKDLQEGNYVVKVTDDNKKIRNNCKLTGEPLQPVYVDGKKDYLYIDFGYYCETDSPTHYPTEHPTNVPTCEKTDSPTDVPTCDFEDSNIGDTVYWDEDGDGKQDDKEEGIKDVTLSLYDKDDRNKLVATTKTDNDGKYLFKDVKEGYYKVKVTDKNKKIGRDCRKTDKPRQPVYVDGKNDRLDIDFGYNCPTDPPTCYPTNAPTYGKGKGGKGKGAGAPYPAPFAPHSSPFSSPYPGKGKGYRSLTAASVGKKKTYYNKKE